jgi:hypothetical protein
LLAEIQHYGTGTGDQSSSDWARGNVVYYGGGIIAGTQFGERSLPPILMGIKNPAFFGRFSLTATTPLHTNMRFFFGVASSATFPNTNDPLNNLTGFGLQVRTSSADFRIAHNDGNVGDDNDATGITPVIDVIFSFYAYKVEGESKWRWYIFTTNFGDIHSTPIASGEVTVKIPTTGTELYLWMTGYNATATEVWINRGFIGVSQDLI